MANDKYYDELVEVSMPRRLAIKLKAILAKNPTADFEGVVRCKDCNLSSEPKSVSRYDLYCNNYDVRFCEKEQKMVCGTHFCSYGEERKDAE